MMAHSTITTFDGEIREKRPSSISGGDIPITMGSIYVNRMNSGYNRVGRLEFIRGSNDDDCYIWDPEIGTCASTRMCLSDLRKTYDNYRRTAMAVRDE